MEPLFKLQENGKIPKVVSAIKATLKKRFRCFQVHEREIKIRREDDVTADFLLKSVRFQILYSIPIKTSNSYQI